MTSEQILEFVNESTGASDGKALWELAYQFAVLNERNASIDALDAERYERNTAIDESNAEFVAEESRKRQENNARLMEMLATFAQRLDRLEGPRYPPGVPQ